jgi:small neutral amino acid transporter SnatA (MarC family)
MSSIGILIGFYGYLFPGNINLMVVHLYTSKQYKLLWKMLVLIALFESFYCTVVLYSLQALHKESYWYHIVEIVSYVMILMMGIWMVFEKKTNTKAASDNTVYRGLLSVIIHPQQIPFWLVVGVLLNATLRFSDGWNNLLPFVGFNAIGTLLVMVCYMLLGSKLIHYFKLNLTQINKVMGSLYVLLALYHLTSLILNLKS